MNRQEVVEILRALPDEELLTVLQEVFEGRQPYPLEAAWHRSRFFLGIAGSQRESDEGKPERWAAWEIRAAAYVARDEYPEGNGPDWGFCQHGTCPDCGTEVSSNVKLGICPICGAAVGMG